MFNELYSKKINTLHILESLLFFLNDKYVARIMSFQIPDLNLSYTTERNGFVSNINQFFHSVDNCVSHFLI